jgi:hypothetical protein
MHAINSGKEKVKGMKPVVDGFADRRLISGDTVFSEYVAPLRLLS